MKKLEEISKSPNINIPGSPNFSRPGSPNFSKSESPNFSKPSYYSYFDDTELLSSSPPRIEKRPQLPQQISTNKLYLAVKSNNHEDAEIALKDGAFINFSNRGKTLLFDLVENSKIDCFEVFLRYKVDLDARDIDGRTAIFYAVKNHNLDMVIKLIDAGAMVDITDFDEVTLLDFAKKTWNEKIVDIIKPYYRDNIKELFTDEVEDASILDSDEHSDQENDNYSLIFPFEEWKDLPLKGEKDEFVDYALNYKTYPTGVIGEYDENDS